MVAALSEEVVVDSPNVAMKITNRNGEDMMQSAEVGDPLALKFEILDKNSPYEIFVRELVAMDGVDSSEIVLIDSDGCPTDHFIMGPIYKSAQSGKVSRRFSHDHRIVITIVLNVFTDKYITICIFFQVLLSHFDAFKFPSSEVVQFRALVTPCMPTCEPVQCDKEEVNGELRSVVSYGRRRRRRSTDQLKDDLLLVQSIQITDKFGFERDGNRSTLENQSVYINDDSENGLCLNMAGLMVAGILFFAVQMAFVAAWTFTCQRRKNSKLCQDTISIPSQIGVSHADSLCKLYESGYPPSRRF